MGLVESGAQLSRILNGLSLVSESAYEKSLPMGAPTVLLVDGSDDCRNIYRTVLEHAGYRVAEARTGAEGLRLARDLRPNLAITEFPVLTPGYRSLTHAIRAGPELTGVRILTVTANATDEYREEALRAGVDGFLTKPLEPGKLLDTVRRFVATGSLAASCSVLLPPF